MSFCVLIILRAVALESLDVLKQTCVCVSEDWIYVKVFLDYVNG